MSGSMPDPYRGAIAMSGGWYKWFSRTWAIAVSSCPQRSSWQPQCQASKR